MRYEDCVICEAEARLSEPRELRQALALASLPDFTTQRRHLTRLSVQSIGQQVGEKVRPLRATHRNAQRRARVAVDATGLAQAEFRTFFMKRLHHRAQKPLLRRR